MSTDKTLADVQPGGRVRLGDGLRSELLDQAERLERMAAQDRETGESIEQALEAGEEYTPDDAPDVAAGLQHDANRSEEIAALLRKAAAALSAQPSPGGQGDALLEQVARFLDYSVGHDPWPNIRRVYGDSWWEPVRKMRDDLRALAARQPVYVQGCDELRARTESERAAYMEGLEEGKKIAARQPVGEPVAWLLISEAGTAIGATRHARERESWEAAGGTTEPLYATPRVQYVDGYQAAFYELADMLGIPAQPCSPREVWEAQMRPALQAAIAAQGPVPMVLHCPRCHLQHIDAPDERTPDWKNPPHRSHLCHGCGLIWRPADVPTIGVESTSTAGNSDTPFVAPTSTRPVACLLFDKNGVLRRARSFTTDGKYVFDAATLARLNEGNPQLAPFKAKLVYASPTTNPADLSEYRDAVMHAYGVVEPDEYCEKLGELLDLIDSQAVGK